MLMFIHIEILTLKILGTGEMIQSIKCFHACISNWELKHRHCSIGSAL